MKWVTTLSKAAGLLFVIISVINFGCMSHSPESFSTTDSSHQNMMVYYTLDSPDYLTDLQLADSIKVNRDLSDSEELLNVNDIIISVDWEHRQSSIDEHIVTFDIQHEADSVSTEIIACDQTWEEIIHCSDVAHFIITAIKGEREVSYRDSINLKFLNDLFVLDRIEN